MMLSDMGAEVLCIERGIRPTSPHDPLQRGRTRIALDLKRPEGLQALLALVDRADVLFEGYRPGVAERLGFGPEVCLKRNPRLVYGRMTGWGQDGPLAPAAGHDINYIALSGALHAIGRLGEKPTPPLNLVGDFGGGGMLLAFGIACALFEAGRSGRGQVVDAAMIDGSIALMAMFIGMQRQGMSADRVGAHLLSGAAHYYDTYETRDGKFIAIGALEPQFYALLIEKAGLDPALYANAGMGTRDGMDPAVWADLKQRLAAVIKTRTRDEWSAVFEGSDACVAPVLTLSEAPAHPHNRARGAFVEIAGQMQNAPAPRFSVTRPEQPTPPKQDRESVAALLERWGYEASTAESVLAAALK
jgi:alpha-methylacyl-CoA racemase